MLDSLKMFDERTLSSFGVSIGTGLAFESLLDPTTDRYDDDREIPNKVDIEKYDYFILNGFTIARNILSSFSSYKDKNSLRLKNIFEETFIQEINQLSELFFNKDIIVILYLPKYIKLDKYNKYKGNMTAGQNENISLIEQIRNIESNKFELPVVNKLTSIAKSSKVLIFTSIGFDLLHKFSKLNLLESYTGLIKDKNKFNTKFKFGKHDLSHIPYLEETLYIFGDRTIIKGHSISVKKVVLEISKEKRWTNKTTREKIIKNLKDNPDTINIFKETL